MNGIELQELLDEGLRPQINKARLLKEVFNTVDARHFFEASSSKERAGMLDGLYQIMSDLTVAFDRVYEAIGTIHQTGKAQEG